MKTLLLSLLASLLFLVNLYSSEHSLEVVYELHGIERLTDHTIISSPSGDDYFFGISDGNLIGKVKKNDKTYFENYYQDFSNSSFDKITEIEACVFSKKDQYLMFVGIKNNEYYFEFLMFDDNENLILLEDNVKSPQRRIENLRVLYSDLDDLVTINNAEDKIIISRYKRNVLIKSSELNTKGYIDVKNILLFVKEEISMFDLFFAAEDNDLSKAIYCEFDLELMNVRDEIVADNDDLNISMESKGGYPLLSISGNHTDLLVKYNRELDNRVDIIDLKSFGNYSEGFFELDKTVYGIKYDNNIVDYADFSNKNYEPISIVNNYVGMMLNGNYIYKDRTNIKNSLNESLVLISEYDVLDIKSLDKFMFLLVNDGGLSKIKAYYLSDEQFNFLSEQVVEGNIDRIDKISVEGSFVVINNGLANLSLYNYLFTEKLYSMDVINGYQFINNLNSISLINVSEALK